MCLTRLREVGPGPGKRRRASLRACPGLGRETDPDLDVPRQPVETVHQIGKIGQ